MGGTIEIEGGERRGAGTWVRTQGVALWLAAIILVAVVF